MLPKYFKGRTLGSFVRQLNMYNFHKVKGQKHRHVFRHPFFKRGDEDSLRNIRRKHVGKEFKQRITQAGDKEMHPWNQLMSDKLVKLREVLDIMSRQNQDLVTINNRMVNELQHLKSSWQLKSKDLISMTANVVGNPNSRLASNLQTYMASVGRDAGLRPLSPSQNIFKFFDAEQGDQFKNQMNIFFVTEQLTSIYKEKAKPVISDLSIKPKAKNDSEQYHEGSCTGGSTNNNTSSWMNQDSSQFHGDRHCNSVDDISQFDVGEAQFAALERSSGFYYSSVLEDSQFESFIIDAFDSLSSDEDNLFMVED